LSLPGSTRQPIEHLIEERWMRGSSASGSDAVL
jgi:hypothetical protein